MDHPIQRRQLLKYSTILAASSLAGCSYLEGEENRKTTLVVRNLTKDRQRITISALDPEENTRPAATLFKKQFELNARDGDSVDSQRFENAFESKRVIIEIEFSNNLEQYTYYPQCSKEELNPLLSIGVSSNIEYTLACT